MIRYRGRVVTKAYRKPGEVPRGPKVLDVLAWGAFIAERWEEGEITVESVDFAPMKVLTERGERDIWEETKEKLWKAGYETTLTGSTSDQTGTPSL